MKYKFLSDVSTAEIAFEAYGKDYSELFENAAYAIEKITVSPDSVSPETEKTIRLEAESIDDLLFSFLEELVFLKDAEQLVFSRIRCVVDEEGGQWMMEARLEGETIDTQKHELDADIKAVTKHLFEVKHPKDNTYSCKVVVDV
jgi:SHS2 domain-containing protein